MVDEVPVGVEEAVAGLDRAVVGAQGVDLDAHADGELRALLGACEAATRRLQAVQTRVAGALTRRARDAAAVERPGDRRAADRAAAGVRRELAGDVQLSPSHAKQLVADDRRLDGLPEARQAYEAGQLSTDHVRVLDRTLAGLTGEVRAELEVRLVEAGRRQARWRSGVRAGRRWPSLSPSRPWPISTGSTRAGRRGWPSGPMG